jgi:hypothetical protein
MVYVDPNEEPEDEGILAPPPPPSDIGVIVPGGSPAGAPTAAAGAGGGGGGKNKGGTPDLGPQYNWPGAPGFVAPTFAKPTFEQAMQEPGYEFRLGAGRDALERSAAARGVLRSGGTLQNLLEYGQKFGAQEYSNVFNRALSEYDRRYQGAKDMYAPKLAQWNMQAQGELQRALALYNRQGRGGGGGGGGTFIPPDILGPPPTMPDYAHSLSMPGSAPANYAPTGGAGGGYDDDELLRY